MGKKLSEMSLEELWKLFPIILTEHNSCWQIWFSEEKERLESFLPLEQIVRISHIGSTAVDSIWAKPIVDILVEAKMGCDLEDIKLILTQNGYICMSENDNRISFNKGYTENGFAEKVFHLHLGFEDDHDELYFRDYLNDHPEIAKEYETLKLSLWKDYEHNRDGYTEAKTDFIARYTKLAKEMYGEID